MGDSIALIVAATIGTFLVAGLVKGVIGLGLPSISIGLLALLLPPAQAAAIVVFPTLITNVWQMLVGPDLGGLIRRHWVLLTGSVIGIWIGGGILTSANSRLASCGLGIALMAYAVVGLFKIRFLVRRAQEIWLSPVIGLATGLVAGATGVFMIPAGPYYQAIGLDRDALVQMLGLSFTVGAAALALVLWRDDVLHVSNAAGSALAVVPAMLGMAIGQRIRRRTSEETFRRYFFVGLLLLGAQQAIRNLI